MSDCKYKLKYFDSKGLAEVSRLLFALAGVNYEDVRRDQDSWSAEKSKTLSGQMPILEIGDKQYCQSSAIARYLARTFDFYGKNDLEALEVDQVLGIYQDIMNTMFRAYLDKNDARKEELIKEAKEDKIPLYLGMLEKILKTNGTGLCVGNTISLADIYVFDVYTKLSKQKLANFDSYPNIKKVYVTVGAEPKIKVWVDNRPTTDN